jgi:hypothetical protein
MALVIVICVATPLTADGGDPIMLPNRLATAKVGEWVTYKIPEGFTQKHMVVERIGEGAKAQVKIRVDSILDGEVVDSIELVEIAGEELTEMPDSEEDGVTVSLARKNLQAAGKTVNGYTIEIFQNGKLYQVWEVAPSLPVYGLVGRKTDDGGQTDFEIVDYSGK